MKALNAYQEALAAKISRERVGTEVEKMLKGYTLSSGAGY